MGPVAYMRTRTLSADRSIAALPPIAIDGRCFVYVFPCMWEDHCKIGFSRDPLGRLQSLHRRWFEFFDLDRALLVQAESVRDARDLELQLRGPLREHRAPAPLTVRVQAGGHTEWVRGAFDVLVHQAEALEQGGHQVHWNLRPWLGAVLTSRTDVLYSWTLAQLSVDELDGLAGHTGQQRLVRDMLDAHQALGVDLEQCLAPEIWRWFRRAA